MRSLHAPLLSLPLVAALACGGPAPTPAPAPGIDPGEPTVQAPSEDTPEATPAPAESPSEAEATAPTPYTADQIRDASKAGREWQYRVVKGDETVWSIMTMTAVDAEGATIRSIVRGAEGQEVGEPKESRATWEELRLHASFPASATTIADDTANAPGGPYDCKRYAVERDGGTATFWFANDLPGAPVKMTVEKDGAVVETRQLMKYAAGG